MDVVDHLSRHGVVPVIALYDADAALPLADAPLEGGLPVAEITFRTPAARAAIEAMVTHRPSILVGASTVLSEAQLGEAVASGARFALSPGFDERVLAEAGRLELPFAPGIMPPSDLQAALRAGCRLVKFFPAGPAGSPALLKAIAAPYAHTGVGFSPTGGVTLANLAEWLAIPEVNAVGGTCIASRADIAAGAWPRIAANAREAVTRVAEIRAAQ
jgi:2-dehydro-3-deoxyphosphogluconate aldolase/(4S)-4-hydroxy-2-oxoglutarate aldolase